MRSEAGQETGLLRTFRTVPIMLLTPSRTRLRGRSCTEEDVLSGVKPPTFVKVQAPVPQRLFLAREGTPVSSQAGQEGEALSGGLPTCTAVAIGSYSRHATV